MQQYRSLRAVVRRHPVTVVAPALLFAVMVALGTWAVCYSADSYAQQRQREAALLGGSYAASLTTSLHAVRSYLSTRCTRVCCRVRKGRVGDL